MINLLLKMVNLSLSELNKERARVENDIKVAFIDLTEAEAKKKQAGDQKNDLLLQINRQKEFGYEREKEFNELTTQFEYEKEKEVVLQSDKATLELTLKHTLAEKKLEYDAYVRLQTQICRAQGSCYRA